MDQLFGLANAFALIGWLLLIAAPRWCWTEHLVLSGAWSLVLAIVYTALIASSLPSAEGNFSSISGVRSLFANDALLTAGWVHYLAFDLFVGAAALRQAHRDAIPHPLMIPILLATFMLGPLGLLVFFVVKSIRHRQLRSVTA
jgi:hypothetical protein